MSTLEKLRTYLSDIASGGICVAFSGGVDSAMLLSVACRASGDRQVHAVTMHTPFHSLKEPEAAAKLAAELGAKHHILEMETLIPDLLQNPPDRCYICKQWIFRAIREYADSNNLLHIIDGTNADDLNEYRPGLQALRELEVKSPLAELGVTKKEVREIAAELHISVAQKPSAPCFATRFPYNSPIAVEMLRIVDRMEQYLRSLGLATVRVRVYEDTLRLEFLPEDFKFIIENRDKIIKKAHCEGFIYVTLDLEGFRSGSMDIPLQKK